MDYHQLNFFGPIQFSNELFGKLNSFVNPANAGTTNEEFSLQYGLSTSISAPRYIKGNGKVNFLNPKLLLAWNDQENDIEGDYFLGTEELSWANIFSGKKISSITESETGLSISLGIETQVFWENGSKLEVSLGSSKIDNLTYMPTSSFGITDRKLNYLGRFLFQTKNENSISGDSLFSSTGQILKGELRGNYTHKKIGLEAKYEVLGQEIDTRLPEDLKTLNLSSSFEFLEGFLFNSDARYDLANDQMAKTSFGFGFSLGLWEYGLTQDYLNEEREKFSLSAIYDDACTRFTFSYENRYQEVGSSASIKALMFRVQLKPFANVVFSQGGNQITF